MAIDLIKELKNKKISFGLKTVVKQAKKNIPQKVFIASDFPCLKIQALQTDVGKNKNTEIKQLDITTEQIQEICKKPFRASVISIPKEKEEKTKAGADAKKETEKKKTKSKAEKKPKKKTAKEKPEKKEAEKDAKKSVRKIKPAIKAKAEAKNKK